MSFNFLFTISSLMISVYSVTKAIQYYLFTLFQVMMEVSDVSTCLSDAALEFCGKTKVLFIYTISGNDGGI